MPKDEKQTMSLIFIYLSQMKICTLIISARESERLPADSRVISKAHCAVDCDIYRCCQLETEKERRRTIWYFFFVAENEAKKYSSVTCMWTVVWSCVKCCGRQIWCWTLPWSGGGGGKWINFDFVPLASQNPYPAMVYSGAHYRLHLRANVIFPIQR